MQIHELNNFTGTLGSGAYLAIDDSECAAQQKSRMDRFKEEAGSYRSETGNIDKLLGIG